MIILSDKIDLKQLEQLFKYDNIFYFDSENMYNKVSSKYKTKNIDMCYWSDISKYYKNNIYDKCYGKSIIIKPKDYKINSECKKNYTIIELNNRKVIFI